MEPIKIVIKVDDKEVELATEKIRLLVIELKKANNEVSKFTTPYTGDNRMKLRNEVVLELKDQEITLTLEETFDLLIGLEELLFGPSEKCLCESCKAEREGIDESCH